MPFRLDPQVAGELGEGTELDGRTHPPVVSAVEYVLDQPENDDLIQSFPVYLISVDMEQLLIHHGFTGFTLDDAAITAGDVYLEVHGPVPTPHYRWLRIAGRESDSDCWIDESLQICVSNRMMAAMRALRLDECDVEEIP